MPTAKPKGGGKRIFGQPAPLVIGGVILAIVAGLYLRSKLGASSAATAPTTAAPAADTSGGAGSSAASPADLTPVSDLASALNGLTGVLGAGGGFGFGSLAGGDSGLAATTGTVATSPPTSSPAAQAPTSSATTSPYINSFNPGTIYTDPYGNTVALQPSGVYQPAYVGPSGSYVSPETYAGAGVTPAPITSSEVSAPLQQATIPAPPHATTTAIMPAPTPKPAPAPVSGYNRKTVANIH